MPRQFIPYSPNEALDFILALVFCVASCNGQGNGALPKNEEVKLPADKPAAAQKDIDPYFVEPQDIISSNGPRSITRNMLQDKAGNYWFASWEGIIRYDGNLFTNFTLLAGLRKYHVFSVMEAQNGDLWFGTIGAGAYRYDGQSFTNFTKKDGLSDDMISCIVEDNTGKIWFGALDGLTSYDPGASPGGSSQPFTNYFMDEGLSDDSVNAVMQDRTGKIWIGTRGGVSIYDPAAADRTRNKLFNTFYDQEGLPFHNVRSIIESKTGEIWIGSEHGLCRYNPTATGSKAYSIVSTSFIGYVLEDRAGNIWASAGEPKMPDMTLYRFDGKSLALGQPYGAPIMHSSSMNEHQVFGILEDKAGNIWFGREGGVYRYDGTVVRDFRN